MRRFVLILLLAVAAIHADKVDSKIEDLAAPLEETEKIEVIFINGPDEDGEDEKEGVVEGKTLDKELQGEGLDEDVPKGRIIVDLKEVAKLDKEHRDSEFGIELDETTAPKAIEKPKGRPLGLRPPSPLRLRPRPGLQKPRKPNRPPPRPKKAPAGFHLKKRPYPKRPIQKPLPLPQHIKVLRPLPNAPKKPLRRNQEGHRAPAKLKYEPPRPHVQTYSAPAAQHRPTYQAPAQPQIIIKQAGPSQQYGWIGHGKHAPYNVPNPFPHNLPKWHPINGIFEAGLLYPGPEGSQAYTPPKAAAPAPSYSAPASSSNSYSAPSSSHSAPAPAPAPSYNAPAPAPAPSYSAPAPAPSPSYSAPAPAPSPSYSAPAPAPAPSYSAPAPAPSYSAPAPSTSYAAAAPSTSYSSSAPSTSYSSSSSSSSSSSNSYSAGAPASNSYSPPSSPSTSYSSSSSASNSYSASNPSSNSYSASAPAPASAFQPSNSYSGSSSNAYGSPSESSSSYTGPSSSVSTSFNSPSTSVSVGSSYNAESAEPSGSSYGSPTNSVSASNSYSSVNSGDYSGPGSVSQSTSSTSSVSSYSPPNVVAPSPVYKATAPATPTYTDSAPATQSYDASESGGQSQNPFTTSTSNGYSAPSSSSQSASASDTYEGAEQSGTAPSGYTATSASVQSVSNAVAPATSDPVEQAVVYEEIPVDEEPPVYVPKGSLPSTNYDKVPTRVYDPATSSFITVGGKKRNASPFAVDSSQSDTEDVEDDKYQTNFLATGSFLREPVLTVEDQEEVLGLGDTTSSADTPVNQGQIFDVPIKVEELSEQGQVFVGQDAVAPEGEEPEVFYIFYENENDNGAPVEVYAANPQSDVDLLDLVQQTSASDQEVQFVVEEPEDSQFTPPADEEIRTIYVPVQNAVNIPTSFDIDIGTSFGLGKKKRGKKPGFDNFPVGSGAALSQPPSYDNPISSYDAPIYNDNSYTAPVEGDQAELYGTIYDQQNEETARKPTQKPTRKPRRTITRKVRRPAPIDEAVQQDIADEALDLAADPALADGGLPYGTRLNRRKPYDF